MIHATASYPNPLGRILMLSSHLRFLRLPDAKCLHLYRCTFAYTEQGKDEMHPCSPSWYRTFLKTSPYYNPNSSISLWGSTVLCWTLVAFSVSWSFYTVGWTPWTGDQPVARPLPAHTRQHKHRINAHRHLWLKWDSNPRLQCLSGRRQFMPYTVRCHCDRQPKQMDYQTNYEIHQI
jgi:hypothetical protein